MVSAGSMGSVVGEKITRQAWYFNGNYPWLGMLFCAPIIGLWYWCTDQYIVQRTLAAKDIRAARQGLEEVKGILASGDYQMVILDEANIATWYNLFSPDELVELVQSKPDSVEIVITGRKADPKVLALADLVTEMKEIKHYYNAGVQARKGIEY